MSEDKKVTVGRGGTTLGRCQGRHVSIVPLVSAGKDEFLCLTCGKPVIEWALRSPR